MPRLVYTCRFEVETKDGLGSVIAEYSDWIRRHYRERRALPTFEINLDADTPIDLPPRHRLRYRRFSDGEGTVFQLDWAYPADSDPGILWRNDIRIGAFGARCHVEHLIWIDSVEYSVTPLRLTLGSPSVVRHLCSARVVQVGDMEVKATPYTLKRAGMADFLSLVQSDLRRLPLVFLAPYSDGSDNEIKSRALAEQLAGVGIVVAAETPEVTWELAERFGRALSCFNGGARIYWPGFAESDDPRRHPLYLGTRIRDLGRDAISRSIARAIFTVASFRYAPDPKIADTIRRVEQAERARRIEEDRASNSGDWEALAIATDEELDRVKQQNADLLSEIENLKANQQILFARAAPEEAIPDVGSDEIPTADSVLAAVQTAKLSCPLLIFLDSAFEAAADSPFRRPDDIAEALQDFNEIAAQRADRRRRGEHGGDIRQALIDRGWKRASMHISDTTKRKFAAKYSFVYEGNPRLFEPHITLGSGDPNSCASIHFFVDDQKGKIVIGHVGRHLPNTKT